MKSKHASSDSERRPVNLVELLSQRYRLAASELDPGLVPQQAKFRLAEDTDLLARCIQALDRNRNQRQVMTLLVHYALMLRQEAAVARTERVQARLARQSDAVRRISRSFAGLARTEEALEPWRLQQDFSGIFPKRYISAKTSLAPQAHNDCPGNAFGRQQAGRQQADSHEQQAHILASVLRRAL